MDLGWVLGGALRLVRRRILLLGMVIALLGLVWWPLLGLVGLGLLPTLVWAQNMELTTGWAAVVVVSLGCTGLVCLLGWWILWPIHRLANCAALLEPVPARPAVALARRLWR